MESLSIKASFRSERGKKNKLLRRKKQVPAVVYGKGQKSIAFSMDIREAEKYSRKEYENKIFTLDSKQEDLNGLKVIKKAVAWHKLSHQVLHMDFLSLDMKKPIRIPLDIHFKGLAKGVKEDGGILNIILRSVEIECLPDKIPQSLDVDISHLGLNQNLHVSDLKLPESVKLITGGKRTLCAITSAEEEEKPEEGSQQAKEVDKAGAAAGAGDKAKKGAAGDKAKK